MGPLLSEGHSLGKGGVTFTGILPELEGKLAAVSRGVVLAVLNCRCWACLSFTLVCLEADIPRGICQVDLYRH